MTDFDQVFVDSFKRAVGNDSYNDAFISRFYAIFMGSSDEIAGKFSRTNMSVQKTMLHDSLHMMLDYFQSGKVTQDLVRVAQVHSQAEHDVIERLYAVWLDSLLAAVAEFDAEYNDQVDAAWREVLRPGIEFMQSKYSA